MSTEVKATHTPGPWDYRPMKHDDWGWVRARNGGEIVAQAGGFASREEQDRHRAAGTDPYEANARLITAAPDLLAALKALIEDDAVNVWLGGNPNHINEVVRQSVAAIAKAEGR